MQNSTERSKAHRLFFIKVTANGVFGINPNDYWNIKLGEPCAAVIQRFIKEGLIEVAPIESVFSNIFTVDQLKLHLKELGLKVGGKKADLVARIIAADTGWVQKQIQGRNLYTLTKEGRRLSDEINDVIGRESGEMEARLTLLIHDGFYKDAFRLWAEWDADQVFPRDEWSGLDNRKVDPSSFIQIAKSIASKLPVGDRERVILDVLKGNGSYNPTAILARHSADYERDIMEWRESSFVAGIKIIVREDTECAFAKQYAGCYLLEDTPDYPFGPCEQHNPEIDGFCTCWWQSVMDDEKPAGGWKVPDKRHRLAGPAIKREAKKDLEPYQSERQPQFIVYEIVKAILIVLVGIIGVFVSIIAAIGLGKRKKSRRKF